MASGAPDLDDGYLFLPSDIFPDEDDIAGHHEGSRNANLADITRSPKLSSFSSSSSSSSFPSDGRKNLPSPPPPLPAIANKSKSQGWMLHRGIPAMERSRDVQIPSRYPFVLPRIGPNQLLASGFAVGQRGSSGGTGVFLPRVARVGGGGGDPAKMDFAEQKSRGEQEQQQCNGPVNGRGVGESWRRRKQSLAHQPPPPYWTW